MKIAISAKTVNLLFLFFLITILIPAAVAAYTTHSGTINSETWGAGTHYVSGDILVNDDEILTIMPGAVVKFAPGALMTVRGTLRAVGSAASWIVFTSMDDTTYGEIVTGSDGSPSKGDWCGIQLYGYSGYNGIGEFDYCRIRYAGGAGDTSANVYFLLSDSGYFTNSISEESAIDGIRVGNCSPEIRDSTIQNNANDGMYAFGSGAVTVTGNTFTGNTRHGLYLDQTTISPNVSDNTGSGNGTNGVVLEGTVAANQSWSSVAGFPIVLLSSVTVNDGITLTVVAGTIVKFGPSAQLEIRGTLDVNGFAGNWVVFTSLRDDDYGGDTNSDGDSSSAVRGDWTGIYLNGYSGYDGIGEFDYCRIRFGGGAGGISANLYFRISNSGHFTNSISEESATDGIRVTDCSPEITNSTFSRNAGHGLTVSSGSPTVINSILWGDGGDEISGTLSVKYSDVQGGYIGEGNINKDPLFIDPDIGDYRLDICSPAIDAGDPIEILTADYASGEYVLTVDRVTAISAGDIVWITDGDNFEGDDVVSTSTSMITVSNGFFYSYAVTDGTYIFTATSDFNDEPAPNGMRINMGAYGGGSEATANLLCRADIEGDDGDVDAMDLREFMAAYGSSTGAANFNHDADMNRDGTVNHNDLFLFAGEFGRIDCPVCP